MKLGFTGTQNGLTQPQREALRMYLSELRPVMDEFHHGDCIGADAAAHGMLRNSVVKIIVRPSDRKDKRAYCTGAYRVLEPKPPLKRNVDIVRAVDKMVACPKNDFEELRSGTWTTARESVRQGKPVDVVWPDGRVQYEWRPEE